jgi:hypothetical protein
MLVVPLSHNITQFLSAFAYFLSEWSALSGSFFPYCLAKVVRNPTESIGEFLFASRQSVLQKGIADVASFLFKRKYLSFFLFGHLAKPHALLFLILASCFWLLKKPVTPTSRSTPARP